eukprot:gene8088-6588_t
MAPRPQRRRPPPEPPPESQRCSRRVSERSERRRELLRKIGEDAAVRRVLMPGRRCALPEQRGRSAIAAEEEAEWSAALAAHRSCVEEAVARERGRQYWEDRHFATAWRFPSGALDGMTGALGQARQGRIAIEQMEHAQRADLLWAGRVALQAERFTVEHAASEADLTRQEEQLRLGLRAAFEQTLPAGRRATA